MNAYLPHLNNLPQRRFIEESVRYEMPRLRLMSTKMLCPRYHIYALIDTHDDQMVGMKLR